MIITDEIRDKIKKRPMYLVTKEEGSEEITVLFTEDEKVATFRADYEAKNCVENSIIYLTKMTDAGHCISFDRRLINEKTLTRTLRSKRFKKL